MRLHFSCQFSRTNETGVHPGQVPLLFALSQGGPMSQKELGDALLVKPPTITVTIRRMERGGLVCRTRDAADQRVMRISLTEQGRRAAELMCQRIEGMEKLAFQNFSTEEILLFRRLLLQMRQNLIQEVDAAGQEKVNDKGY